MWDVEKAVLRGKCLILNAYIGKKKKALNHLCFYFRKLEKNKLNLSYVDENNKNLGKKMIQNQEINREKWIKPKADSLE